MNLKNNLIASSSFFLGYFLYFYYMIVVRSYTILQTIGMITLSTFVGSVLFALYLNLQKEHSPSKPNEWAIVTGCTSGLGYSLAKKLSKKGFNLILIARNKKLLDELETWVNVNAHVKTHIIVHDFANNFESLGKELEKFIFEDKECPQKTIGLLINNVGIALDDLSRFVDYPVNKDIELVNVNILSIIHMTKFVLPLMIDKQYGYIVNIGSASCLNPGPYISTYSATKAFIDQYTKSMAQEYSKTGVHFHVSYPAFFVSGMTKVDTSLFVPNSDVIADGVLRHLSNTHASIPYFLHYVQMSFAKYHWYSHITEIILNNIYADKEKRLARNKKDE